MAFLTRSLLHTANVAGFATALAIASTFFFHAFGPPKEFRDRMAYFREHKDTYDVVFVGSSVTKFGIDPKVFDRALLEADVGVNARLGAGGNARIRSFNMGIRDAYGFEVDHRIREIVAMKPECLKWMLIEPRLWKLKSEREFSDRDIWWHSWRQTRLIAGAISRIPVRWRDKFPLLAGHLGHWSARCLNVGKGSNALGFLVAGEDEKRAERELSRYDDFEESAGYWRLTREYIQLVSPGLIQLADAAEPRVRAYEIRVRERIAELDAQGQTGAPAPAHVSLAVRDQVKFLRANGIEPIYVLPPGIDPYHSRFDWVHTLFWEGVAPEPFAFDDPRKYPDLYAASARFDDAHLSEDGATLYSIHLAHRMAEKIRGSSR